MPDINRAVLLPGAAALLLGSAAHAAAPRLLVVVVVDQMRADYLDRFGPELQGGLARLRREGFVFTQARHNAIPTETAVGHATILSGRTPAEHGILGNHWWDHDAGRVVQAADDALFGLGPEQMLAYTLGDAFKAKHAGARVVCLSQKDRSAILLCGKRPDAVVWYDRSQGELATSRYYGRLPAWAESLRARERIEERYALERGSGTPPSAFFSEQMYSSFTDQLMVELAERALSSLNLGADDEPDLLALSLSANDYIGHRHGPDSPQIRESMRSVDSLLGRLLDTLDGQAKPYVLVLTSDHGVARRPDHPGARERGARTLRIKRLAQDTDAAVRRTLPLPDPKERWVLAAIGPHVYLNRALAAARGVPFSRLLETARRALAAMPGMLEVYSADEIIEHRLDGRPFADRVRRSFHPARAGDLMYVLDQDTQWDFEDGHACNHGQAHDHDSRVPLIFFGTAIAAGRSEDPVTALDIAPTAARLFEVPFASGLESHALPLP